VLPLEAGGAPPLKVGLLLDGLVQPQWVARVIEDIQASACARVVLVVVNDAARDGAPPPNGLGQRLRRYARYGLYALYNRLDARLPHYEPDALASRDLGPLLGGCPLIHVRPRQTKHCDFFEPDDVRAVAAYDLDVAFRFGFRILKGPILDLPRHGVWSYHHGDNRQYRGGPPGFWEVMQDNPVTGCVLQRLSAELDGGQVLARAQGATDRGSVKRNRNRLYWSSVPLALRALAAAHASPAAAAAEPPAYEPYSARLYTLPSNREMLPGFVRLMGRRLAHQLCDPLLRDQWFVAYRLRKGTDTTADVFHAFKPLVPPPDRFWADPFAARWGDRYVIFVEEYVWRRGKAHIAAIPVESDGTYGAATPVLDLDYHLSYPFVFEWRGEHFMVPETRSVRRIELYRADPFPFAWRRETVLLDGVMAADATLAEVNGRWWLFYSEGGPGHAELHLLHADTPLGPWQRHRHGPFKLDASSARPAGALFRHGGALYRPAQDCTRDYGHQIVIHRVDRLDEEAFEETPVGRITPDWAPGVRRTHTLNHAGELTVVDGLRRVSRLRLALRSGRPDRAPRAPVHAAATPGPVPQHLIPAGAACQQKD
jgi:hypothetical protein